MASIEIGQLGRITDGEGKGQWILVQDQLAETGGYLILMGQDPSLVDGADYWLEGDDLERAFQQKKWVVDWKAAADDPKAWRLNISQRHIDLYQELIENPRPLNGDEARMMVELVDAWRDLEHRKHIALEAARSQKT